MPACSSYLEYQLEALVPPTPLPELRSAEAIVVLAADIRAGFRPASDKLGPQSIERLMFTAEAFQELRVPVVTSGGRTPHSSLSVSDLMKQALERIFYVPVTWTEERSRTTYENAVYTAELLRKRKSIELLLPFRRGMRRAPFGALRGPACMR